jgi:hypothetical protein
LSAANATDALAALGISREEVLDRIVEQSVRSVLERNYFDEDGELAGAGSSALAQRMAALIKERIDAALAAVIEKNILPNAATYIENVTLQATNHWGEKTGKSVTFLEYLTQRAEAYLTEQVDSRGKTKEQESYSWRGVQPRIAHLVHEHLHYSIEAAMKVALKNANEAIVGGLAEAVTQKLGEVAKALKVEVKT